MDFSVTLLQVHCTIIFSLTLKQTFPPRLTCTGLYSLCIQLCPYLNTIFITMTTDCDGVYSNKNRQTIHYDCISINPLLAYDFKSCHSKHLTVVMLSIKTNPMIHILQYLVAKPRYIFALLPSIPDIPHGIKIIWEWKWKC